MWCSIRHVTRDPQAILLPYIRGPYVLLASESVYDIRIVRHFIGKPKENGGLMGFTGICLPGKAIKH